jgi:hypothetical protein
VLLNERETANSARIETFRHGCLGVVRDFQARSCTTRKEARNGDKVSYYLPMCYKSLAFVLCGSMNANVSNDRKMNGDGSYEDDDGEYMYVP